VITVGEAYDSVDWSVVVLLGAMIPVGLAVEGTGIAREVVAKALALGGGGAAPGLMVAAMLAATMVLTNVMNNAATAVVMAPVAVALARELGVSSDPFLMAVAVGSAAAFLTPVGHQSNTLVMGPGGYHFEDYWKLGLPLSILTVAAAVPLILWWWPLFPR
jgi:di/tricarboxylate transporter